MPDALRAAYTESMHELKKTLAQIDRVQRQIDTLPRKPRKSRLEPITVPGWYRNEPDPILAAAGAGGRAYFVDHFRNEVSKSKSAA